MPRGEDRQSGAGAGSSRAAACLARLRDTGVRSAGLMLTNGCNLRCVYCSQDRVMPRTMAPHVLDAAIRRLVCSRLDRPQMVLHGGEPLLAAPLVRRALDRVQEWAPPRMKPDIHIVTNGTRLDEEMTHLLVSRNVFMALSFDGIAAAQDDRSPGSFGRLDRLLVRLQRDHPTHFRTRLAVLVTLTSRNVPFLSASIRYFLSRFVRNVSVVAVLPDDDGWNEEVARELDSQLAEVVTLSIREFRRSGEVPFQPFRDAGAEPMAADKPGCSCGDRQDLVIDVDGSLAPCAALVPSTFRRQPKAISHVMRLLGGLHVTDRDLPSALLRREKRARRLSFLAGKVKRKGPKGPCARCRVLPTCFVCPIAVAYGGGRVPKFHCDVNRLFSKHRTAFQRMSA
jgi:sulfatase maturation enzyme AslB (radical SAM superfamily)